MPTSLEFRRGSIQERAKMFASVRSFFAKKGVLEVDTDILSQTAPIDVMHVGMGANKVGYLHTSPEYGLKKLLAKGSGDIYQLSHVFRAGEESPLHTPEFMMLEWYRVSMPYETFIEEACDLIRLFLPNQKIEILSYRKALLQYAQVDLTQKDLSPHVIPFSKDATTWDRDTQLNLLFSHLVEPHLGKNKLTVITGYPASQAALAKTIAVDGMQVARRFEIYHSGIELANGFDELTDPVEQEKRLTEENKKRMEMGKESLPIDKEFIKALETLPECCGVAVGFDRLMWLSTQAL